MGEQNSQRLNGKLVSFYGDIIMESPEKSVNQFIKECREAGLTFEFKASNDAGLVVKSKGWVDDDRIYTEISPTIPFIKESKKCTTMKQNAHKVG